MNNFLFAFTSVLSKDLKSNLEIGWDIKRSSKVVFGWGSTSSRQSHVAIVAAAHSHIFLSNIYRFLHGSYLSKRNNAVSYDQE